MTQKLRCKFIAITMSIVTIMLCAIMSTICFITKMNLENNSIHMMQNMANHPFLPPPPNKMPDDVRLPYFILQLNVQGELIAADGGYYDLSDENFLKELIHATFSASHHIGVIKEYNLRFYRKDTAVTQTLVYVDISNERTILNSLIRNCVLIGTACFLIFLSISFRLANWVVKPVEQAWEQQRQFIADASHELKTPLTVIMTNAELIQNSNGNETDTKTFAGNILIMSKQMRILVEQMLELARADHPRHPTIFSSVDLTQLISNAILPFEPVFFEKGLMLHTDISENITVAGDASQLRQVLDILLDNAQKYSREKGATWITLQRQGKGHCLLTVTNEGDEIPQQELNHLFKRFYRADKARSRTGSFGLGLSIAETFILRHKGKIWAESKNNINTFFVELPIIGKGRAAKDS